MLTDEKRCVDGNDLSAEVSAASVRLDCMGTQGHVVADTMTAEWRARRVSRRLQRIRASAEPARPAVVEQQVHEQIDEMAVILNDLLKRWHRWQAGYSPVPVCSADPMFRNVKSGKTWDSTSQVIRDELNGSTMEAIDFQVGELPDDAAAGRAYRSAIYAIARNLHAGCSVWSSPRLPQDPMERGVVCMEARNMLTRRLIAAGVM